VRLSLFLFRRPIGSDERTSDPHLYHQDGRGHLLAIREHCSIVCILEISRADKQYIPLCRLYTRIHVAGYKLYDPLVSTCYRQQNCCQFVARLLLDTKGYKSTVTSMNSNYVAEIQSTCIPNERLVSGNMCPLAYMYLDTSCSSGIHVSGQHRS